ncbi:MAG: enoyl-CoA hydratase/isomerase family protein [Ignavibacteriae bacterium]|nr:enoyl-CoA hydratase/isomerase family protein [Ignavibacteriota bacterium]MCB9217790.1 enoyl-CoA hydratase/isomerase family protein [Ignavibacteria bacterium]
MSASNIKTYSRVVLTVENGVGQILLNRPEKRNALDRTMVEELYASIKECSEDESVRSIVISGAGTVFCAGADLAYLRELSSYSITENMEDSAALARTLQAIWESPKPVIARVHGHAIAGGCGLATVCDVVVAVEAAKFGYTEVGIGFIPAIVMAFLLRKSPQMLTRELLLSGRVVSGAEAYRRGLITTLVTNEEELDREIESLTTAFGKADPTAVRLTKEMMGAMDGMSLEAALDYASRMNAAARMTPGCQAGIQRFLEKAEAS